MRIMLMIVAAGMLSGCGLAGVGGAAATDGAANAAQAEEGKKQLEKVHADLDAAQKAAADARDAAEKAAE